MKSAKRTLLNIQTDAVTWVGDTYDQRERVTRKGAVTVRRDRRRGRRFRKTPCRANRQNRARGRIPPSTKARWQWKLRICHWLARRFPIECFLIEDVKAKTMGKRRWDSTFSPLEVGKQWFYAELSKMAQLEIKPGFETYQRRQELGLNKTSKKTAEIFSAHCVDAWVLANSYTRRHTQPDNTRLLLRDLDKNNYPNYPAVGGISTNHLSRVGNRST